ncbi:MAG: pyruvate carboxyltransferase [Anaerolineae bacterium]|jgi:isopropylmalate/homocitrate/citramalate synthase
MSTPWRTDKHFVSPLNYLEEVRKDFKLADNVKIHDITLRDGEQQTGVALRKDEKIRIAEKLAEVGIHRIEAGMPAVSKQDEEAIREIVKRNLGPEIFGFCRCIVDDVKLAADCGVTGVVVEIPSSEHIIEYAYQWPLAKAIDLSVKATRYAHEQGLYVVFFTIDATRADLEWLLQIIGKVAEEGHMDALALVDTMGVASVPAIRYYVRHIKGRLQKPLEAHFHNDFGLANANSLVAVEEGAEVIHSTVLGTGERAGQASTEQIALALELLYGVNTGIRLDKLYELGRLVADLTHHTVPANQPVVGERVFQLESGIPSSWWLKVHDTHPTEVFPLLPALLGRGDVELVLGKGSGADSIAHWLEELELAASPEQIMELTLMVKEMSMDKKGLLTKDEFREMVSQYLV